MRDEEPVAPVADVADDPPNSRYVYRDVDCMTARRNVFDRHRTVPVQLGGHRSNGRVEACRSGREATKMCERSNDADQSVAAHAEVRLVVEKDDPAQRS